MKSALDGINMRVSVRNKVRIGPSEGSRKGYDCVKLDVLAVPSFSSPSFSMSKLSDNMDTCRENKKGLAWRKGRKEGLRGMVRVNDEIGRGWRVISNTMRYVCVRGGREGGWAVGYLVEITLLFLVIVKILVCCFAVVVSGRTTAAVVIVVHRFYCFERGSQS